MDKKTAHPSYLAIPPLRIVSWNIDNFGDSIESSPSQRDERTHRIAWAIGQKLHAPHLVALQEVCGDKKYEDGQPAPATENIERLIDAIQLGSGYTYAYAELPPPSNQEGGAPNFNIRNGYLYRTDRVALTAPATPQANATLQATIDSTDGLNLQSNPSLIDPANPAFIGFRKPLVAQFTDMKTDEHYYLTNLHLPSNGRVATSSTDPITHDVKKGWMPDPVRMNTRREQALLVRDFQQELLATINAKGLSETHHVVCLGDFNTASRVVINGEETPPANTEVLDIISQSGLTNVADEHLKNVYSVGNDQKNLTLDHVYVSPVLRERIVGALRPAYTTLPADLHVSDHNPTLFAFKGFEKDKSVTPTRSAG